MTNTQTAFTATDLRDLYLEHSALGLPVRLADLYEDVESYVSEAGFESAVVELCERSGVRVHSISTLVSVLVIDY